MLGGLLDVIVVSLRLSVFQCLVWNNEGFKGILFCLIRTRPFGVTRFKCCVSKNRDVS